MNPSRRALLVVTAVVLCAAGCGGNHPAEKTGKALDKAATDTGKAVEKAADKVIDTAK